MNAKTAALADEVCTMNDNSPALMGDHCPASWTPVDGKLARLIMCCPDAVVGESVLPEADRLADDHCSNVEESAPEAL